MTAKEFKRRATEYRILAQKVVTYRRVQFLYAIMSQADLDELMSTLEPGDDGRLLQAENREFFGCMITVLDVGQKAAVFIPSD